MEFILMDGAMAYSALAASKYFADQQTTGFATLMPHEELRLTGPILLASEFSNDPVSSAEVSRAVNAFPHRLHMSVIDSGLTLEALADHLRRFVHFSDSQGQPYGLRIADCRVVTQLSDVLTQRQWDAVTAPMTTWHIHDRTGAMTALPLNETRRNFSRTSEGVRLSDDQIDGLMRAGEPDALLSWLELQPENVALESVKWHHDVARFCLQRWQQSGSADRGILRAFAGRVFASKGMWLEDADRVEKELRSAAASVMVA